MGYKFGRNVLPSERRPVSWYSPGVLQQAGRELVSSIDFLRNSDRRELFEGDFDPLDFASGAERCDGFDFIADTGDGGNATFTVAQAALQMELDVAGTTESLARPPLLVFGGDLAYPGANSFDYHYRLLEPFALARPSSSPRDRQRGWRDVVAIPQNHDWFDSTTTFCRYFVARSKEADGSPRPTEFVDAFSRQQRTYFAAHLPHRWWILGLDFALKGDIDRKQFRDFCTLWAKDRKGPRIERGDNIILLYPEPYWTRKLSHGASEGYTTRYQRLEHLLEAGEGETRETNGANAHIRLRLAGDLHHYCRHYTKAGAFAETAKTSTHLVTCGTGGAFLHTTHGPEVQGEKFIDRSPAPNTEPASLGRRIRVGLKDKTLCGDRAQVMPLEQNVCYPSKSHSRMLALTGLIFSILGRPNLSTPPPSKPSELLNQLWDSNLGFALCLGLLYGFNAYVNSIAFSDSFGLDDFQPMSEYSLDGKLAYDWVRAMFFSPFATLVNIVMIAGCIRIAWEGTWPGLGKFLSGLIHGLVHGVVVCVIYFAAAKVAAAIDPSMPLGRGLLTWALVTAWGCLAGALIFGLYFAVMNGLFGQLTNNASGAIAVQDYKGFMRFKFAPGHLEATFLACDQVPRKWRMESNGDPEHARIVVDGADPVWRIQDRFKMPH